MWGRGTGTGAVQAAMLPAIVLAASGFLRSAYPGDGGDRARADPPAPARQTQLIRMVRHDCGSCHGLTLAGGLGPALDAQALRDKPAEYLEAMILRGRPGTAMPGWAGLLSEQDARWIANTLKEGFPDAR
jgi:cytochrome c55X